MAASASIAKFFIQYFLLWLRLYFRPLFSNFSSSGEKLILVWFATRWWKCRFGLHGEFKLFMVGLNSKLLGNYVFGLLKIVLFTTLEGISRFLVHVIKHKSFYVLLTLHLIKIFVNKQIDEKFFFLIFAYSNFLHISSTWLLETCRELE